MSRRLTPLKVVKKIPTWIVIAFLFFIELYPLFWLFMSSLKSRDEYLNKPAWSLPTELVWGNYATAWTDGNLAVTIRNSMLATLPSLLFIIVLGVAAGFALEVMVFRGRNAVLLTILAGIMIPGQMILLPLFTIYSNLHITGTLWPLILTYTACGLPLTVFMMATYFRAIPREIFEAATIDGASILRSFRAIAFPMVRNAIVTVALVQFFLIWNDLLLAITFANNKNLQTVQAGLLTFSGQFGSLDYGPLFAAICITTGGLLIIYLFLNQRIMKGLTAGSLKG
ncbi:MAG: ABC transporter permease [Micrococcales bacterium 70-64]|nr:carbohydrate ABC transporter permease [Leifsonia sp.]ODU63597.1 MAG: ABC transporter permease [Leifsonia sp. SCN 70-46]OJX85288.1 MAG: ABC transporter permease [Micrococcales bacterium 70-64]